MPHSSQAWTRWAINGRDWVADCWLFPKADVPVVQLSLDRTQGPAFHYELGKELNYTIMGNQEFKYRRDITDVFLYDILEGRKLVVIDEVGLY